MNEIIYVSGVRLYNTSPVCSIVRSPPPEAKSPSTTVYCPPLPPLWVWLILQDPYPCAMIPTAKGVTYPRSSRFPDPLCAFSPVLSTPDSDSYPSLAVTKMSVPFVEFCVSEIIHVPSRPSNLSSATPYSPVSGVQTVYPLLVLRGRRPAVHTRARCVRPSIYLLLGTQGFPVRGRGARSCRKCPWARVCVRTCPRLSQVHI